MGQIHKITELSLKGKKVLVRVDFNVPIDGKGYITDDTRIVASLPTIKYILEQGGIPILMSHLGRPDGHVKQEFSLEPEAIRLSELLGVPVKMAPDCIGPEVVQMVDSLKPGDVLLLENLRFHKAEEHPESDPSFAEQLAELGDCYVNDAFGTAHRAHASTVFVPLMFPGKTAAGFLIEKEIEFLGKSLLDPEHPFVTLIGGAKISTKLGILQSLIGKADTILVGGAMAFTFFKAMDIKIGNSLFEEKLVEDAKRLLKEIKKFNCTIIFPEDLLIAKSLNEHAETKVIQTQQGIPDGWMGVDIGPLTVMRFAAVLKSAATVFWNGPMGVFEIEDFSYGTRSMAQVIASVPGTTIVGGGDSIAAIHQVGVEDRINHISTGGGASLEYIENGTLPGIEVLEKN